MFLIINWPVVSQVVFLTPEAEVYNNVLIHPREDDRIFF